MAQYHYCDTFNGAQVVSRHEAGRCLEEGEGVALTKKPSLRAGHCPPLVIASVARQSISPRQHRLPRRFAPRNDESEGGRNGEGGVQVGPIGSMKFLLWCFLVKMTLCLGGHDVNQCET